MGYIILSTEDVHIMPDSERYEVGGNERTLRLYDEDGEETALFNFENVVTVQEATDEEMGL